MHSIMERTRCELKFCCMDAVEAVRLSLAGTQGATCHLGSPAFAMIEGRAVSLLDVPPFMFLGGWSKRSADVAINRIRRTGNPPCHVSWTRSVCEQDMSELAVLAIGNQ